MKTEEKNPPLQLLEVLVVAGWNVFVDDKQKFIIPFILDWSSRDHVNTTMILRCML